jgi:hypothetical protein
MSAFDYSVVILCPAALQADGNLLACALGHDTLPGSTFSVPVSTDGAEPVAYYGCRTDAQQSFVDVFGAAAQGALPPIVWEDFGLTLERVAALLPVLIFDAVFVNERDGHFDRVIADQDPPLLLVQSNAALI